MNSAVLHIIAPFSLFVFRNTFYLKEGQGETSMLGKGEERHLDYRLC